MLAGMFDLYSSNDAEALLTQLAARIGARTRAEDLLAPEIVLVPQFGLRRWLEIRLAERCGIVANVDFYAPAEYAWRLLRAANPQLPETSLFERNVLHWRIFAQLGELAGERRFAALDAALGEGDQATRLRLAGDLAHWFERYLAYRSDLLERWERGAEKDEWQAELWRRLTRGSGEAHRARLLADYVQRYGGQQRSFTPPGVPVRISAFACTNVSPDLLRFYGVVAQHCEFDFLMPNPCREYWGDVRSERARLRDKTASVLDAADNPLLAACGGAGRDFIELLYSYESVQPRFEADSELSREIQRDSLLHRLQADVLDRLAPALDARTDADGRSLQFHICHSKLREVQVLHDRLLDLFDSSDVLTPRDVAVMAPDVSAYAPYIEAVFGSVAREDRRYLPYTLSDASPRDAHPLTAFALRLAALPLSRLGLSEVIELLGVPAVLRKFDLDRAELDRLETWLRDAGVRWGLDENQHAAVGAGCFREFSWAFGIERLLLGYASGEDDVAIAGIAPRADVEGNSARTLGALLSALDVLQTLLRAQSAAHTPRQWQQIYNAAFDHLLDIDPDDRGAVRALGALRAALAGLAQDAAAAACDDALDWRCVRDFLTARLGEPERSHRFFSGGISICGMLPLRAVPFRVICLIGMNEDAFPRCERLAALDRMTADGSRRRGDRANRDDDRYLFLQLLCATRDVFYLSWIGEEQRDGSAREPSAVVAELLDIVATQYCPDAATARRALVTKHPLQAFSPRNFRADDTRLFTYRGEWRAAAGIDREPVPQPFAEAATASPTALNAESETVDLDTLKRFFAAPARVFLRERLGMWLDPPADADEDADHVVPDNLGKYILRETLVEAALSGGTADAATLRARALLPAGRMAGPVLLDAQTQTAALLAALRDEAEVAGESTGTFMLQFDGGRQLSGTLPAQSEGRAVVWAAGALHGKRLLNGWLDYLALAAHRDDARLTLFGMAKTGVQALHYSGLTQQTARAILAALLRRRDDGLQTPLLFFPKTSAAYARRWRQSEFTQAGQRHADALSEARKAFAGERRNDEGGSGEADREPPFALIARDRDLFGAASTASRQFAELALEIFDPLLDALHEVAE